MIRSSAANADPRRSRTPRRWDRFPSGGSRRMGRSSTCSKFTQPLQPTAVVCSDAIAALNIVSEHCQQEARVTPPQPAAQRLPVIHIVIDNFKRFLLGTPHSVSGNCLHEYICEFVYRFNHRLWQLQLPQRLLHATETVKVLPN